MKSLCPASLGISEFHEIFTWKLGLKPVLTGSPFLGFSKNRIFEVFCTEILSTESLYIRLDDWRTKCYPFSGVQNVIHIRRTVMQQISDYELELMKIIWANGGTALYAEIVKALEDKGTPWTKNTIITLLSRLANKGFLKASKTGFRNQYTAVVSETVYQEAQTKTLLDKVYEGNAKGLVSTLIQKDLLSSDDYEDLRRHWKGGACDK